MVYTFDGIGHDFGTTQSRELFGGDQRLWRVSDPAFIAPFGRRLLDLQAHFPAPLLQWTRSGRIYPRCAARRMV